uniref:APC family permease n=1 Tax=Bacillus cereus TaxID=1396 RepID=UPI00366E9D1D
GPKKLKRSIGVVGGTLLTLSCVTPASTLFVVVPDLFGSLGTATALTIAIGSLLCVAVAFCYSELGTLVPSAGGEYAMVSTLAGRLAGWLVFVLSLLVVMIVPPVIAMGTADYLAPLVHLDPSWTGASVMLLATLAISAVIILVPVAAITLGAPDLAALTGGDISTMVTAWSNSAVGTFVSLCVALAIINAGIVMVIQNSRVLFASARDKAWPTPVNSLFSRLGRFGSPWVSTLAVGVPGAALCFVNLDTLYGVTGVSVTGMYLLVAVAALLSRRGSHKHTMAWRMPLWPAAPLLLIVVLVYILSRQETTYLLWTGGITAAATLYWALYLRPRKQTRWLVSVPEDEQAS